MSQHDVQQGHFEPDHFSSSKKSKNNVIPPKKKEENWFKFYRDYFLGRPMLFLIVIGLLLEVQPYEPIQPTYFIATRIVNREEITIKGVEDEQAHSEGVKSHLMAQIDQARDCQNQREISANTAHLQCVQSGKGAGYCRHVYDQAKQVHCPSMPDL